MNTIKTIKVKASGTNLFLSLEDYDGIQMGRSFEVRPDRVTSIPINYAKSMFNFGSIERLYKEGKLIIVDGEDELIEMLQEEGEIISKEDKIDTENIRKILKGSNITSVKALLNDPIKKGITVEIAREEALNLNTGVLRYIEDEIKIPLILDK